MSILLKDIPMPQNCHECNALGIADIAGLCIDDSYTLDKRKPICPLIEIPDGKIFGIKGNVLYTAEASAPEGKKIVIDPINWKGRIHEYPD